MFRSIAFYSSNVTKKNFPLCDVSLKLQQILGSSKITQPEAIKGVWAYINSRNLNNKEAKKIISDRALEEALQRKEFTSREVMGLISKQLTAPPKVKKPTSLKKHSPALQAVTGVPESTHRAAIKLVWDYIEKKGLKRAGQQTIADEKLAAVFGPGEINPVKVTSNISVHYLPEAK